MRAPAYLKEVEVQTRNYLLTNLERGKVEVSVSAEQAVSESASTINVELLGNYKKQIENLSNLLELPAPNDWYTLLLRMPDAMHAESPELTDADFEAYWQAMHQSVAALADFRLTEGKKLYNFFITKIENIGRLLNEVGPHENGRVAKIRARLEEQLEQIDSIRYDKGRLEQELIFYIEKLDISEEKLRLRSHLDYFLQTMGGIEDTDIKGGVGKKLGFISQEMGREINTLGSKSNNAEMQKIVVEMKDELEQIKEQVLNVL